MKSFRIREKIAIFGTIAKKAETKPETSDDPTIDPDYENWGRKNANVNYTHLIPYLIKSNQELYIKNDALETQLTSVLTRLDALENPPQ